MFVYLPTIFDRLTETIEVSLVRRNVTISPAFPDSLQTVETNVTYVFRPTKDVSSVIVVLRLARVLLLMSNESRVMLLTFDRHAALRAYGGSSMIFLHCTKYRRRQDSVRNRRFRVRVMFELADAVVYRFALELSNTFVISKTTYKLLLRRRP